MEDVKIAHNADGHLGLPQYVVQREDLAREGGRSDENGWPTKGNF